MADVAITQQNIFELQAALLDLQAALLANTELSPHAYEAIRAYNDAGQKALAGAKTLLNNLEVKIG